MTMLAHILKALAFLLHRIVAATCAIEFYLLTLYLHALACTLTLNENTRGTDTRTCGDLLEQSLVETCGVYNQLHILDGGTIVECYEIH